jgi:hypothetical protein
MAEVAPLSLLRQINYRTGARLPKFPRLPKEVVPTEIVGPRIRVHGLGHGPHAKFCESYSNTIKIVLANTLCNFEHWEYRFWRIELNSNQTDIANVVCRCCQEILLTKTGRQRHKENKGCYNTLVEAYKLLLADKICVICNKETLQKRWGIPMCCMKCENIWLHEQEQPEALAAALMLYEMNKRSIR